MTPNAHRPRTQARRSARSSPRPTMRPPRALPVRPACTCPSTTCSPRDSPPSMDASAASSPCSTRSPVRWTTSASTLGFCRGALSPWPPSQNSLSAPSAAHPSNSAAASPSTTWRACGRWPSAVPRVHGSPPNLRLPKSSASHPIAAAWSSASWSSARRAS